MEKNNINCPNCKVPTQKMELSSLKTSVYYPAVYDENGKNTNPDRNTVTTQYKCLNCQNTFKVKGNDIEGYKLL